jgi:hypothetical protein
MHTHINDSICGACACKMHFAHGYVYINYIHLVIITLYVSHRRHYFAHGYLCVYKLHTRVIITLYVSHRKHNFLTK